MALSHIRAKASGKNTQMAAVIFISGQKLVKIQVFQGKD